jgi:hypothetical protein
VFLDWFFELPEGHRVFSSAFEAAGQIYFGTSTAETEDPCDGPSTSGVSSMGNLFVFSIEDGSKHFEKEMNSKFLAPVVVDEHVYLKSYSSDVESFGSGVYNNPTVNAGFPTVEVRSWNEIF